MVLTGIDPMNGNVISFWEKTTEEHIMTENGDALKSAKVQFIGQDPPRRRRKMEVGDRFLQDKVLKVKYTQILEIVDGLNDDVPDIALATEPFVDNPNAYIDNLKENIPFGNNFDTLEGVAVSERQEPTPSPTSAGGLGTGALIGIIVGSVVGLAVLLLGGYCFCRRRRTRKGYFKNVGDSPPMSIKQSGPDEVSTIGDPIGKSGGITGGESVADYGDQR